jgi:hypothetical protein
MMDTWNTGPLVRTVLLLTRDTWSVMLRAGYELRAFGKRVLRGTFRSESQEVRGSLGKLLKEDVQYVYSSPNIIMTIKSKYDEMGGHVACMGETINAYKGFAAKREETRPTARPRHRRTDLI